MFLFMFFFAVFSQLTFLILVVGIVGLMYGWNFMTIIVIVATGGYCHVFRMNLFVLMTCDFIWNCNTTWSYILHDHVTYRTVTVVMFDFVLPSQEEPTESQKPRILGEKVIETQRTFQVCPRFLRGVVA